MDASEGVIGIEWIEGQSIRVLLDADDESDQPGEEDADAPLEADVRAQSLADFGLDSSEPPSNILMSVTGKLSFELDHVMSLVGVEIAKMHIADVVHGDLTTSNMMLRKPSPSGSKPAPPLVRSLPTQVFHPLSC